MLTSYIPLLVVAVLVPLAQGSCPFINSHRYGSVSCTDSNREGSKCTLMCEQYFDLAGTTDDSIVTECGYDGEWSVSTRHECEPVKCFPEHVMPEYGDLICTADNLVGSLCVFYCNEHYDMQGVKDRTAFSVCKDDGNGDAIGYWTNREGVPHPPVCELITCDKPFSDPENGKVVCSSDNNAGSLCIFHCDEGYDLVGTSVLVTDTKCKDDDNGDNKGKWTQKIAPTCRKIVYGACNDPPTIEGVDYECTSENFEPGTVCTMMCRSSDEQVLGDPDLTCNSDQMWKSSSGEMPKCSKCSAMKNIQIVALIHSEKDKKKFVLAAKLITRLTTVLEKRRVRLDVELRATRYNDDVSMDGEFYTSSFQSKRDKSFLEELPFTGSGENIEKALQHADKYLPVEEGDDKVQVVLIITDDLTSDENATAVADELRERGVSIFCIGMKSRGYAPSYMIEDLAELAGSEEHVHEISTTRTVETVKDDLATQIRKIATEKGCSRANRM